MELIIGIILVSIVVIVLFDITVETFGLRAAAATWAIAIAGAAMLTIGTSLIVGSLS